MEIGPFNRASFLIIQLLIIALSKKLLSGQQKRSNRACVVKQVSLLCWSSQKHQEERVGGICRKMSCCYLQKQRLKPAAGISIAIYLHSRTTKLPQCIVTDCAGTPRSIEFALNFCNLMLSGQARQGMGMAIFSWQ